MTELEALADEIARIGFACTRCGDCCRGAGEEASLVMVSRGEARAVADAAGLSFADAVVPYPDEVGVRGRTCHLGWALARDGSGACRYHDGAGCSVYRARPGICRTYPFMLDGERLVVSECRGLGRPIDRRATRALAEALVARRSDEEHEAQRVRALLAHAELPASGPVVVDAEGVWRP